MDSIALFASNATLVYFGELQPEVEAQAKKLYQLAKNEITEWLRLELLKLCRTPGVSYKSASLRLPASDYDVDVSVDISTNVNDVFKPCGHNMFPAVNPPFGMSGSPYSDSNYVTPIGDMPYELYRKIVSEETPVSRLFDFLSSEYKKLTDEVKNSIPSEPDMEALFVHDVLYLHRYGGIIRAFEAIRTAPAA